MLRNFDSLITLPALYVVLLSVLLAYKLIQGEMANSGKRMMVLLESLGTEGVLELSCSANTHRDF